VRASIATSRRSLAQRRDPASSNLGCVGSRINVDRRYVSAANWAALGILYNTGQDCTAGSRLFVQDSIYDKFISILTAKAKELTVGDGFDEKSGGGPVVRDCAVETLVSRMFEKKKTFTSCSSVRAYVI
jgi:acyl-CoA reductase-like NAD-dependent aldehyde dehydrogenase